MEREKLIQSFKSTQWLIKRMAEGVTPEESLLTPPFRGNCFNWVLGHIVNGRNNALLLLEAEPVLSEAQTALYKTHSTPITVENPGIPLPELLALLDQAQERIAAALPTTPDTILNAIYSEEHQQTVADRLAGLHWHETYHLGQLELLRQLGSEKEAFP